MKQPTKKRFAGVWDAIEDAPEKAANLKLRSSLMIALKKHFAGTGLSRTQIAKFLGVAQPRVSDLMRGKIDVLGLDTACEAYLDFSPGSSARWTDADDRRIFHKHSPRVLRVLGS